MAAPEKYQYSYSDKYPEAHLTQWFTHDHCLIHNSRLASNDPSAVEIVLREFRKADAHHWGEWVKSVTPFGDEAMRLQAWAALYFRLSPDQEDLSSRPDLHPWLSEGPLFPSKAAGARALAECVFRVHDFLFQPPPPSVFEKLFGRFFKDKPTYL